MPVLREADKIFEGKIMKPIKITAIILLVMFPLSLVAAAQAGLWTDFKKGFKKVKEKLE